MAKSILLDACSSSKTLNEGSVRTHSTKDRNLDPVSACMCLKRKIFKRRFSILYNLHLKNTVHMIFQHLI